MLSKSGEEAIRGAVPADAHLRVWPNLLAFFAGLALAAWAGWDTTGLVWSLWLSSLVVGYASLVFHIARMMGQFHGVDPKHLSPDMPAGAITPLWYTLIVLGGGLVLLAFFTVHFGGFHWGHSLFLNLFFPIDGKPPLSGGPELDISGYWEIVKRCWWFLPLAFIAERAAFLSGKKDEEGLSGEELSNRLGEGMVAPYRNVIRLHVLIFFFAFVTLAGGVQGPLVFLVVYAVYFFPWWIVKRKKKEAVPA